MCLTDIIQSWNINSTQNALIQCLELFKMPSTFQYLLHVLALTSFFYIWDMRCRTFSHFSLLEGFIFHKFEVYISLGILYKHNIKVHKSNTYLSNFIKHWMLKLMENKILITIIIVSWILFLSIFYITTSTIKFVRHS